MSQASSNPMQVKESTPAQHEPPDHLFRAFSDQSLGVNEPARFEPARPRTFRVRLNSKEDGDHLKYALLHNNAGEACQVKFTTIGFAQLIQHAIVKSKARRPVRLPPDHAVEIRPRKKAKTEPYPDTNIRLVMINTATVKTPQGDAATFERICRLQQALHIAKMYVGNDWRFALGATREQDYSDVRVTTDIVEVGRGAWTVDFERLVGNGLYELLPACFTSASRWNPGFESPLRHQANVRVEMHESACDDHIALAIHLGACWTPVHAEDRSKYVPAEIVAKFLAVRNANVESVRKWLDENYMRSSTADQDDFQDESARPQQKEIPLYDILLPIIRRYPITRPDTTVARPRVPHVTVIHDLFCLIKERARANRQRQEHQTRKMGHLKARKEKREADKRQQFAEKKEAAQRQQLASVVSGEESNAHDEGVVMRVSDTNLNGGPRRTGPDDHSADVQHAEKSSGASDENSDRSSNPGPMTFGPEIHGTNVQIGNGELQPSGIQHDESLEGRNELVAPTRKPKLVRGDDEFRLEAQRTFFEMMKEQNRARHATIGLDRSRQQGSAESSSAEQAIVVDSAMRDSGEQIHVLPDTVNRDAAMQDVEGTVSRVVQGAEEHSMGDTAVSNEQQDAASASRGMEE